MSLGSKQTILDLNFFSPLSLLPAPPSQHILILVRMHHILASATNYTNSQQHITHKLNNTTHRMVRSVTSAKEEQEAERRKDIKQANSAMSLGFNVIVTMATMFVAGWFLARNAFGGDVAGVIGGLVCSIAAMLVEMWLFVIRGSRLDSQDEKKAKRLAELQKRRPVLSGYGTPPSKSVTQSSPNFTF